MTLAPEGLTPGVGCQPQVKRSEWLQVWSQLRVLSPPGESVSVLSGAAGQRPVGLHPGDGLQVSAVLTKPVPSGCPGCHGRTGTKQRSRSEAHCVQRPPATTGFSWRGRTQV